MKRVALAGASAVVVAAALCVLNPTAALALPAAGCTATGSTATCVYYYTGAQQTFVVPDGVSSVTVTTIGAAGADEDAGNGVTGGRGGRATATIAEPSGSTLFVEVGGIGTTGGGHAGSAFNGGGGGVFAGGGGASDVRTVSNTADSTDSLTSRLIVAGGGGGGGSEGTSPDGTILGGAGGDAGSAGSSAVTTTGGGAGTLLAGGAGGVSNGPFPDGQDGVFGQGGGGASFVSGGGGGGGYYGGGQGGEGFNDGCGGGGGGSNFIVGTAADASDGVNTAGLPPEVLISYDVTAPVFGDDAPPAATQGTAYSYTFAATGVPAPTFSVASGSLPPGLTLDPTTGTLSGTPTGHGTYTFSIAATNIAGVATGDPVTIDVAAAVTLATTGVDPGAAGEWAMLLLLIGALLAVAAARSRRRLTR